MSGLTWLHLSDWHHEDLRTGPEVLRDRLVKDIGERTAISPDLAKIDFIVFSGDVAQRGLEDEYREAKREFFEYILEAAGVSARRLFIVPGNHDLNEDEIKKLPDKFQNGTPSKDDVDLWLRDDVERELLLQPFRNFKSFVFDYTGQDSPDFSSVRTWKIDGKIVSVLGINSAWWCRRQKDTTGKLKSDARYLMVGEHQIHKPLEAISNSDLKIAVLHHSQDWLEYTDGSRIWSRLRHECDFILHGHGHEPKVTAEHGTGGDCIIIPAGASFDNRVPARNVNSYNFVHLDLESGIGTVFLRRWNDEITQWKRDDQTCEEGKFPFNLPDSLIISHSTIIPQSEHLKENKNDADPLGIEIKLKIIYDYKQKGLISEDIYNEYQHKALDIIFR